MKKLLLTIAAGMLILSLPVIASAAALGGNIFDLHPGESFRNPQSIRPAAINSNAFDEYSGYTARISARGFYSYSTSAGKNAGFKRFSWTEKADTTLTGPKNTAAEMSTINGTVTGEVVVLFNAHTAMEILIGNAIGPANGKVIHANALYLIVHSTGDMTLNPNGTPPSVGLTGAEYYIEGGCTITASINPTTHNMVLSIGTTTALSDGVLNFTSVSGTPDNTWSENQR